MLTLANDLVAKHSEHAMHKCILDIAPSELIQDYQCRHSYGLDDCILTDLSTTESLNVVQTVPS